MVCLMQQLFPYPEHHKQINISSLMILEMRMVSMNKGKMFCHPSGVWGHLNESSGGSKTRILSP